MLPFNCACGGPYTLIPDEEVTDLPPTMQARKFHCADCLADDWLTPWDIGLDEWPGELESSC